ncbi:MAG: rod shape-determining protein MreD [Chloroflexi bacterium ADurb.Bin325]|nr:MAG: rod shape-determining protein MreD [Chloroflexi bacterium ADurb.Bin325]
MSKGGRGLYLGLLILGLVVFIQGTLFSRVRVLGVGANLLLVTVVCWSLTRNVQEGLVWAFAGGLGIDLVSGLPLGTSSLALMPTCFLAGIGRSSIYAQNLFWPLLLVVLATPLYGWLVLLTQQMRGVPVDWLGSTVRIVLPELAPNLAITLPVYPGLRWLAGRIGVPVMDV